MNTLANFILISGIVLDALVLGILWHKKDKELPHRVLLLLFGSILFVITFYYASINEIGWLALASYIITDPIAFIAGPLLILYVKSLIFSGDGFFKKHWYYFIPMVLYVLLLTLPVLYFYYTKKKLFGYLQWLDEHEYILPLQIIILLSYAVYAFYKSRRYERTIKENYSNLEDKDISWIRHLLLGIIAVGMVDFSTTIFELIYGWREWDTGILTIIALVFLIGFLGYKGVSQSNILLPSFILANADTITIQQLDDSSLLLSEEESSALKESLLQALEKDKAYLDEELTLTKLSKQINTTNKKLSWLLNQHLNTSFYDIINKYRVEAVKDMIDSGDYLNYSLQGIAYEAGFKSKTSFFRVFRKYTGMTPSQYKEKS